MSPIKCFFLEPTDQVELWLRRFQHSFADETCPLPSKYHQAAAMIGESKAIFDSREDRDGQFLASRAEPPHDDPRWPKSCECGYVFEDKDTWQICQDLIYARQDTGERMTLRNAPVGAMWFSDWMLSTGSNRWRGPDGHSLTVRIPGQHGYHDWCVDGTASNCTKPNDLTHKCWCRRGQVPAITVDKTGNTCDAGGGSIGVPGFHGFLRDGFIVEA